MKCKENASIIWLVRVNTAPHSIAGFIHQIFVTLGSDKTPVKLESHKLPLPDGVIAPLYSFDVALANRMRLEVKSWRNV